MHGRIIVIAALMLAVACGEPVVPSLEQRDFALVEDAPPAYTPPSLRTTLHSHVAGGALGYGSVDLAAHPEDHEIRVGIVVGAAAREKRWNECDTLVLHIDDSVAKLDTRYSGVPMQTGVYDAVRAEVTIDHVRAMAGARRVSASLCGDLVEIDAELASLDEFVARFEEMATYDGPPPPAPPPAIELPIDEDELLPDEQVTPA